MTTRARVRRSYSLQAGQDPRPPDGRGFVGRFLRAPLQPIGVWASGWPNVPSDRYEPPVAACEAAL